MLPKVIKNYNLHVDGVGMAGLCSEVRLPSLRLRVEDHRAGGMDGVAAMDMGMERIDLGFALDEHHEAVLRQFGLQDQNAVQLTFRAAKVNDTVTERYLIQARGMYTEVNLGQVANGAKSRLDGMVACRYFKITMNGRELWEVDVDNMIRKVNGIDQLAAQRAAIGR